MLVWVYERALQKIILCLILKFCVLNYTALYSVLQNNAQILEIPDDSACSLSVARSTRNANLWLFWVKRAIYCYRANRVKNSRWSWWYHLKVNWLTIILNKSMISRSCGRNYSKGRIVGLYPAAKRQMLQYYTVYLTSYWYGRSSSEQLTCWSSVRTFQTLNKRAISQDTKRRTFLCKLYSQY